MFSHQFRAVWVAGSLAALLAPIAAARAASESIIYSFPGGPQTAHPLGGLVQRSGVLYGEAQQGGPGFIFSLTIDGVEKTVHEFSGLDGFTPANGLIIDSAGVIYGTTLYGGSGNFGNIFQLAPNGQLTSLFSFPGGAEGQVPTGRLVRDNSGNIYGTAEGGNNPYYDGVVFKLAVDGTYTVLHTFTGGTDGGGAPSNSDLAIDSAGNLYGTTLSGGSKNHGVVFKIASGGTESVLYSFTGSRDGAAPTGGVVLDNNLNAYGTTYNGGANNDGVVFKVTPGGTETVLYDFTGGADGAHPYLGGLTLGPSGKYLYGTAFLGGSSTSCSNCGSVFAVPITGGGQILLHDFAGSPDGMRPSGDVLIYGAGRLYGTTALGGAADDGGAVYQITN